MKVNRKSVGPALGIVFSLGIVITLMLMNPVTRRLLPNWIYVPAKSVYAHFQRPDVVWEEAAPSEEGMDADRLDKLREGLAARHTDSFLVVRGGRIVYEWYALRTGPNADRPLAAMAKAVVAVPTVLVALTDNRMSLDDPLSKFAPQLKDDSVRSQIRLRDLLFHQSGLDDVDFNRAYDGDVKPWQRYYYEHPDKRFDYALFHAPIIFPPGTRGKYSGVGYYALAYAVTKAIQDAPESDIKTLFSKRIMKPLGIPSTDCVLSYGESYESSGLKLYAFGSGANLPTRAVARIGELVLDRGQWHGQRIFDARSLDDVLGRVDAGDPEHVSDLHGFVLNRGGRYPPLPRDAFLGHGNGDNIVLIVPSLDLVVVRTGDSLAEPGETSDEALDRYLFRPIVASIVGTSSRPGWQMKAGWQRHDDYTKVLDRDRATE